MTERIDGRTKRAADMALAKRLISRSSHEAILVGALSLDRAKELGREGGPGAPTARSGSGAGAGAPGRTSDEGTDAPQDTPKSCLCGCGRQPKSPKSRFVQGHDHRLYGELKRTLRNDPLLRSDRITDDQRRYAVERGLVGPKVLPEEERDG